MCCCSPADEKPAATQTQPPMPRVQVRCGLCPRFLTKAAVGEGEGKYIAHECDVCRRMLRVSCTVWRCGACDYDLCPECACLQPPAGSPTATAGDGPHLPPLLQQRGGSRRRTSNCSTPTRTGPASVADTPQIVPLSLSSQPAAARPQSRDRPATRSEPAVQFHPATERPQRQLYTPSPARTHTGQGSGLAGKLMYVVAEEGALVREGYRTDTRVVGVIPYGSEVLIGEEPHSRRVRLRRPLDGWASIETATGQKILQPDPDEEPAGPALASSMPSLQLPTALREKSPPRGQMVHSSASPPRESPPGAAAAAPPPADRGTSDAADEKFQDAESLPGLPEPESPLSVPESLRSSTQAGMGGSEGDLAYVGATGQMQRYKFPPVLSNGTRTVEH